MSMSARSTATARRWRCSRSESNRSDAHAARQAARSPQSTAHSSKEALMIEAAMIWNEPNNKSHWDPEVDPDWSRFAQLAKLSGAAIRSAHSTLPRVLGGMSPIDPGFITNLEARGVLDHVDVVAVHGFPLDWNLWRM